MATYKENGKWFTKGKIKKDDGSYYNYKKIIKGAKNSRDAKDFETDFLRGYQDLQISKKQISFESLCDEYLLNDTNIKKVSQRTKKDSLDRACKYIGVKKINLITREHLQKFIKCLEDEYSSNYVSKIYYAVNGAFNYAVDQGYLHINIMSRVRMTVSKDKVKKEMLFWEPTQFDIFLKYADTEEYKVFFMTLYYMGIRKGEAQALKWNDINFDDNVIRINKTITNKIKGVAWEITSPKTKNSIRNISMPKILKESLNIWKDKQSKMYNFNDNCFVFGLYKPLSRTTIGRKLALYVKLANDDGNVLPLIRVHDFRHSHASFLLNNMTDKFTDFDVSKRLGDTVETLHNTYAHWFKSADKGIIEMMDGTQDTSKYAELKELKELLDDGVITDDDYSCKKKLLLGI